MAAAAVKSQPLHQREQHQQRAMFTSQTYTGNPMYSSSSGHPPAMLGRQFALEQPAEQPRGAPVQAPYSHLQPLYNHDSSMQTMLGYGDYSQALASFGPSWPPVASTSQPHAQPQQQYSNDPLFSRSELQAIDGFLDSFSSSLPPSTSAHQPYSSQSLVPPGGQQRDTSHHPNTFTWQNQHNPQSQPSQYSTKYLSYHPTAFPRPHSPSSSSAASLPRAATPGQTPSLQGYAQRAGSTHIHQQRASNSPFSSASMAEESQQEREKRLRAQADDLASWLSRHDGSQAAQAQSAQSAFPPPVYSHHQSASLQAQPTSRSSHSPTRPQPMQLSGPPSLGSTSNSESLPTPSNKLSSTLPTIKYAQSADAYGSNDASSIISTLEEPATQEPKAKRPRASPADPHATKAASKSPPAGTGVLTTSRGRATSRSTAAAPAKKRALAKSASTAGSRRKSSSVSKSKTTKSPQSMAKETVGDDEMAVSDPTAPAPEPVASTSGAATTLPKSALTEEQKRANHIASEQKRRYAIRAAYNELCNVVPTLRAAVREYEERLKKLHPPAALAGDVSMTNDKSVAQTVAGVLTGGIEVGGEKIDGRAGPKSEAVVLAKTVEYLRDLLDEREESLARLKDLQTQARKCQLTSNNGVSVDDVKAPWNLQWPAHRQP